MTPVYEIPSEFDLVGYICNNTVFFEKDVELGNDEYYIWKDSVVTKLDADFIEVLENGYATIKLDTASASTTYNFYNAQGTIVKTVVSTVENPLTLDHGEENGKIFVLLTDKNEKTTLVIFAE